MSRFLKTYSYVIDRCEDGPYLESFISFLDFVSDMKFKGILAFIGLKNFLGTDELIEAYERIFFHELNVILLEREHDTRRFVREVKTYVNLQLLKNSAPVQSGFPPSCSEGFAPMVLEQ